jgi:hypothetical protein
MPSANLRTVYSMQQRVNFLFLSFFLSFDVMFPFCECWYNIQKQMREEIAYNYHNQGNTRKFTNTD